MAKGKAKNTSGKGRQPAKRKNRAKKVRAKRTLKSVKKPTTQKAAASKPIARKPLRRRIPAPRPAPAHKAPAVSASIYDRGLERTAANYAPLTPLQFIERQALIWSEQWRPTPITALDRKILLGLRSSSGTS